jgi:hypothetical protein
LALIDLDKAREKSRLMRVFANGCSISPRNSTFQRRTVLFVQTTALVAPNYNDVVVAAQVKPGFVAVTDVSEGERRIVEIEASAPRNPALFGRLLDRVVDELTRGEPEASRVFAIAGVVVAGTSWSGFRSGRTRLATAAASYLNWMAPPLPWARVDLDLIIEGRRPIGWRSDDDLLVDVLVQGEREAASFLQQLRQNGVEATALRAIDSLAPTRSKVYERGSRSVLLRDSAWDLGGRTR